MTPEQVQLVLAGHARIETELAQMRTAIVTLARVEERIANYTEVLANTRKEISEVESMTIEVERRIDKLEQFQSQSLTIISIGAAVIAIAAPYLIDFILK